MIKKGASFQPLINVFIVAWWVSGKWDAQAPLSHPRAHILYTPLWKQVLQTVQQFLPTSWRLLSTPLPPNHPVGHLGMSINLDLLCIRSFAYCLKIALSLCKRNETNILYCCCEQFTIPSSYSVFFLCPLYTCLHRGPGVSNKVNSFSESVIFM